MILAGTSIAEAIQNNEITIEPFSHSQINPNSYNYRLAPEIIELENHAPSQTIMIPEEGMVLRPGKLYLARTTEFINSNRYVVTLLGRSSLGRLGLFVCVTADLGHIGSSACWTLELKVVQPLRVYPHMVIGQLAFWIPTETNELYTGAYHSDRTPKLNKRHKRMDDGGFQ